MSFLAVSDGALGHSQHEVHIEVHMDDLEVDIDACQHKIFEIFQNGINKKPGYAAVHDAKICINTHPQAA